MLKEAKYENFGWPAEGFPEFGKVVYAIIGNCCYFSGIEKEIVTSTINAAEGIIQSIAEQEGVAVTDLRFFDLQTHKGYNKPLGAFEFDELIIELHSKEEPEEEMKDAIIIGGEEGFSVVGWRRSKCPEEVIKLFREHIGFLN